MDKQTASTKWQTIDPKTLPNTGILKRLKRDSIVIKRVERLNAVDVTLVKVKYKLYVGTRVTFEAIGYAVCAPCDTFDPKRGFDLALARAYRSIRKSPSVF